MTEQLAPTELGQLLEAARKKAGISGREAARRSGFSAGRWTQIVKEGRAPALTVVAAAQAVRAEPAEALTAAGHDADPDTVRALLEEAQRPPESRRAARPVDLAEEIERIRRLPLPAEKRLRVAQGVIALFEEQANEARANEPDGNLADQGS